MIRPGEHVEIAHRNALPFRHIQRLGMGATAQVEVVEDPTTRLQYAHKLFKPYYGGSPELFKKEVRNEIDIIKRLRGHPHMIQVEWSYASGSSNNMELGILLTPVASDGDLRAYMHGIHDQGFIAPDQKRVLVNAFGCLASGLAFLHHLTIRHKDIKPTNILVHRGHVIFTDFGIAKDAGGGTMATDGTPGAFTDRYRAPEVAEHSRRNSKSDVFSLGCVFVEIVEVMFPNAEDLVTDRSPYWQRVEDVQEALVEFSTIDFELRQLFVIFYSMLESRSEDRIGAAELVTCLQGLRLPCRERLFCGQC